MPPVLNAALIAVLAVSALACGNAGDQPASDVDDAAAATVLLPALTFDGEIRDAACEILTTAMVSEIVGHPPEDLRQTEMWGRICIYKWAGGEARLTMVSVEADAQVAAANFDRTYQTVSATGAAEAAGAVSAELDRQAAAGEIGAEQAAAGSDLGGMLADVMATQHLESVDGIGDRAVYDGTVRTMTMPMIGEVVATESTAAVVLGNVTFTVEAKVWQAQSMDEQRAGPPPEARARDREVTLSLARAVAARLVELN